MKTTKKSIQVPLLTLVALFGFSICVMWPGVMSPDGIAQYTSAVSASYSDHHPPMMSFIWRYLNYLHKGPGLMLVLHLLMLYVACAIFVYLFRDSKFKWWYAFLPVTPWILAYTPLIVKDVGFAFSYLLAGAILAYLVQEKIKKHKWPCLLIAQILLFYGCAVKYQAQFILPFFTLVIGFCIFNYKNSYKSILCGITLYFVLLQLLFSFNNYLVPKPKKSNSWEFVKLYDLSAISLHKNVELFPSYIKQDPNYSFAKVKQYFVESEVDALVFTPNPTFRKARNEYNQRELVALWKKIVWQNPMLYLKVRFNVWKYNIIGTPSNRTNPAKFLLPIPAFNALLSKSNVYNAVGNVYNSFKVFLQFTWLLPLVFIYFYIGIVKFRKSRLASVLLLFSISSIAMLLVLFFMSMAGTARYIFICLCLLHASHGFAYRCLQDTKRKN